MENKSLSGGAFQTIASCSVPNHFTTQKQVGNALPRYLVSVKNSKYDIKTLKKLTLLSFFSGEDCGYLGQYQQLHTRFAPNQQIFARISRKKGHIMRTSFAIQPLPGNTATRQLTFDPTSRDDTEVLCYA